VLIARRGSGVINLFLIVSRDILKFFPISALLNPAAKRFARSICSNKNLVVRAISSPS
jgi:hypothetical protein